jgi:effector-binding domain-containing protein
MTGGTGAVVIADAGFARFFSALTGGTGWGESWTDAALDAAAAALPEGASAVRLRPSGAPEGDLFVIDARSSRLVEAHVHLPIGKDRTLSISVRHDGAVAKGSTITIDREHYRFLLSVETLEADPGLGAFDLPSFLQDRKEPTFPMTEIVTLDEVHTAHVRKRVRMAEISKEMATLLPAVMNHVRAQGVQPAGPPYSRYWSMPGEEIDIEVGFPVARPLPETDTIKAGKLPGGRTISTWHVGPYHEMGRTWQSAMAWMNENKLTGRGAPWEVYWTDPGLEPDSSKWRTQILLPVQ